MNLPAQLDKGNSPRTSFHTIKGCRLDEFPPADEDVWRERFQAELERARASTPAGSAPHDGIPLRPLYRPQEVPDDAGRNAYPGFAPFARGLRASGYLKAPWTIFQDIPLRNPAAANSMARHELAHGATGLLLIPDWPVPGNPAGANPNAEAGPPLAGLAEFTLDELDRVLEGIDLERVPMLLRCGHSAFAVGVLLAGLARRRHGTAAGLRGGVALDPLGGLAATGRVPGSLPRAYDQIAGLTRWARQGAPEFQAFCCHGDPWHEAGADAVQQLGLVLATAVEYLRELHARGLPVDQAAAHASLALSVGTHCLVEIAKFRAVRMLWAEVLKSLGAPEAAPRLAVHARTGAWNKTIHEPSVNILRTTVEAFAAVVGGCDTLHVGAFDAVAGAPSEASRAIARNLQLILRDEWHLDQFLDPAGGSWCIESVTHQLAHEAWTVFQTIEQAGGMAAALRQGLPQQQVARTAEARRQELTSARRRVVGVNWHPNPAEWPPPMDAGHPAAASGPPRLRPWDPSASARHRDALARVASQTNWSDAGSFAACLEAAVAGASVGELTQAVTRSVLPDALAPPVAAERAAAHLERLGPELERFRSPAPAGAEVPNGLTKDSG